MIRVFCDVCEAELDSTANRSVFERDNVRVEVIVAIDGTWNGGHICVPCIKRTVAQGEVKEKRTTPVQFFRSLLNIDATAEEDPFTAVQPNRWEEK